MCCKSWIENYTDLLNFSNLVNLNSLIIKRIKFIKSLRFSKLNYYICLLGARFAKFS